MKRSTKPRVSWPPGNNLCQVKVFRTEDCPAKVASQPQRRSYPKQSNEGPDLPPGFEGSYYAVKSNVANIPRVKWKRPPKITLSKEWLLGDASESTERHTQNLRIVKLPEAFYPHRNAVPPRPFVSPVVEAERYDDTKTPVIPIEEVCDSAEESSPTSLETSSNANKQDQLEAKLPSSSEAPVSRHASNLSLIASAALAALEKTKEQVGQVDPDLLVKLLSDPEIVKKLMTDTKGKTSETKTQQVDANINPARHVPQHVITSPMASKPQPVSIPQEQRFAVSKPPFTSCEQRRVSPPKPGNGNISSLNPLNGNQIRVPMPVHSPVGIATTPYQPARLPSSSVPVNPNLQRPQFTFSEPKVMVKPQPQLPHYPGFNTSQMNNVQASSVGFGRVPQTRINSYPMNLNQVDASSYRPKPVVQPSKSVDYFKNLIRKHGTENHETNQYHSQNGKITGRDGQRKVQKQCIYFGTAGGCILGESCIYVHDRSRPNFDTQGPMAKRMKFGRYEQNGL